MPAITLQFDKQQIGEFQSRMKGLLRGMPQALAAVVNEAAKQDVKDVVVGIQARANIREKDIKATRTVAEPSMNPSAGISVSGKKLSLLYFGAHQTPKGVSYKIGPSGHSFVPGGFILRGDPSGVFRREGTARLPIKKLYGPSPWGVLVKSGLLEQIAADTEAELATALEQKTAALIERNAGGGE